MNYIYDIYLNLNEILYDFFDWNKNDKLSHIKKIPVFKISEDDIKKIMNHTIKVREDFLLQIYSKTEVWNMSERINYCSLFTDGNNMIAIEFNKNGNSIRKSYLFIDEELEVLEIVDKLSEKEIEFKIINEEKSLFKTRAELKQEKFVSRELRNIEDKKLDYIYFECFGKHEDNKKIILDNINKISKNSKTYKNLYDILKLTSQTRK